jgi:cytolysin-activating lysine-acyltransferase
MAKIEQKKEQEKANSGGQKVNLAPLLGAATALMMESPAHQHMFLADMKWLLIPPLQLQQFRIFRKGDVPIAYVSWAFLDEDTEKRVSNGQIKLRPDEWSKGESAWIIDLVAPFGGHDDILKALKKETLKGRKIHFLQATSDGLTSQQI